MYVFKSKTWIIKKKHKLFFIYKGGVNLSVIKISYITIILPSFFDLADNTLKSLERGFCVKSPFRPHVLVSVINSNHDASKCISYLFPC